MSRQIDRQRGCVFLKTGDPRSIETADTKRPEAENTAAGSNPNCVIEPPANKHLNQVVRNTSASHSMAASAY